MITEERGVRIVFRPDAKLIGDRRKMTLETLVSDLEYADDVALLSSSWRCKKIYDIATFTDLSCVLLTDC